ncbi:hypothetical protein BWD14_01660 [Leptospira santarosai]|uniref:Uncharacterized protein n=1 Tax=Leptospira santarosai TaxID=28183 RepID=A0AB73MC81_9LEPT|nr:hypothetical protein [Leptospira santarosai]ONF94751.1 hypothetical protein BWD14_01660 [Leptospira santarosai]
MKSYIVPNPKKCKTVLKGSRVYPCRIKWSILISTYLAILCFKHFQNVTELEKKQIDESYFKNATVGLFLNAMF